MTASVVPAVCKVSYMNDFDMDSFPLDQQREFCRHGLRAEGLRLASALAEVDRCKLLIREGFQHGARIGLTEVEMSRLSGLSRPTVRDWLGK